eukprot:2312595-Prymnesium_polylepis.2
MRLGRMASLFLGPTRETLDHFARRIKICVGTLHIAHKLWDPALVSLLVGLVAHLSLCGPTCTCTCTGGVCRSLSSPVLSVSLVARISDLGGPCTPVVRTSTSQIGGCCYS